MSARLSPIEWMIPPSLASKLSPRKDSALPVPVTSPARYGMLWHPAIEAAKAVLDKAKEARPDGIELKFGVKVSGTANWLVARAATEGNFEITLSWSPSSSEDGEPGVDHK